MQVPFIPNVLNFTKVNDSFREQICDQVKFLYLLNRPYALINYIPKNFTITTQNGSYKFNVQMLRDASTVISRYLYENPNEFNYHLDIEDKDNIMSKFEKLFLGEPVLFTENETPKALIIIRMLNFARVSLPLQNSLSHFTFSSSNYEIQLTKQSFKKFLIKKVPKSFVVTTKNKKYPCNSLGIFMSKVFRDQLQTDPSKSEYTYDFEDEFNEFQLIVDFFNAKPIQITSNNVNSLKKISEDLQIECMYDHINNFIETFESSVQIIEDRQAIIDEINEIFHLLYHVKELTVENVKESIIDSSFAYNEENVQELAAFFLQVVHSDYFSHPYLVELLVSLNEEANEDNDLHIFLPFVVKQLMLCFGYNKFNCAFIYKLYKKGIISEDMLSNKLCSIFENLSNSKDKPLVIDDIDPNYLRNIIVWYFPEILKFTKVERILMFRVLQKHEEQFVRSFISSKIDSFIKMRDSGEPDSLITKALLHDDVDLLQLVVSKNNIDITNKKNIVPFNIFDCVVQCSDATYLNYSAAYGSVKCFKYLLLNHAELTPSTFSYAIYGGNSEIIVTVDQYYNAMKNHGKKKNNQQNFNEEEEEEEDVDDVIADYRNRNRNRYRNGQNNRRNRRGGNNNQNDNEIDDEELRYIHFNNQMIANSNFYAAYFAILRHRNDLFDWIMEKKFVGKGIIGNSLSRVALMAVSKGNIHALIYCIDSGLDFNLMSRDFCEKVICKSAEKGFLKLAEFLFCLMQKKMEQISQSKTEMPLGRQLDRSVLFGNASIFLLFLSIRKKFFDLEKPLMTAVKREYFNITKIIVQTVLDEKIQLSRDCIISVLDQSIKNKSPDIFLYLIDAFQFGTIIDKFSISSSEFNDFLLHGCKFGNLEAIKIITDIAIEKKLKVSFTEPFISAAFSNSYDICDFFIQKKVFINFLKISQSASKLIEGDEKIFNLLINIVDPEVKEEFLQNMLLESIKNKKSNYIELLLNKKTLYEESLFEAVRSKDVNIVNIILKHDSKPSFINQISVDGTALNIAASANNLVIVQRLLSLPGIDASLYGTNSSTPLISAIRFYYIDVMNAILDFYGDDIQQQMWQLDEAFKFIFTKFSSSDYKGSFSMGYYSFNGGSVNQNDKKINTVNNNEKAKIYEIISRLIQIKNINLNHPIGKDTFLTYACKINEIELVRVLLKSKNINVNLYESERGNTPLMIAIENNYTSIAEYLIEYPQTNINLRNFQKKTALTFAAEKGQKEIVSLLLNNERFDPIESCLNYAFFNSTNEIAKQLVNLKELDVNCKFSIPITTNNYCYNSSCLGKIESTTALQHAISNNNLEMVDIIVKHPTFDPVKSQLKTSLFKATSQNKSDIFKKLIDLMNNEVNIFDQNGDSLLIIAATNGCQEIVTRIVENSKFDARKSDIFRAFMISSLIENEVTDSLPKANVRIMETIVKYDKLHDHLIDFSKLLSTGKSFFTSINRKIRNMTEVASFFLRNGVDPNKPDSHGLYPLEYAIGIGSLEFVQVLTRSGKVDFSIRLKNNIYSANQSNQTYLHLAARGNNQDILAEFLNLNPIDVNATDDLGETPLMEACKHNRLKNVRLLFETRNLNYLCHNNNGEDALKIAKKSSNRFSDDNYYSRYRTHSDSRSDYLSELATIIHSNVSEICNNLHENLCDHDDYQNEYYDSD